MPIIPALAFYTLFSSFPSPTCSDGTCIRYFFLYFSFRSLTFTFGVFFCFIPFCGIHFLAFLLCLLEILELELGR